MADESYWTYRASERTPTHGELPQGVFNGTEAQWCSLSPGMRREIYRGWKRRNSIPPPPC